MSVIFYIGVINIMKIKNNKLVIYWLIPLFLFFVCFITAMVFNSHSVSALVYPLSKNVIKHSPQDFMVKGDTVKGEFVALKNNLGILQVKFNKYRGINYNGNDRLYFSIKEKNSNFAYSATYPISEFDKSFILPFGFPLQENSAGKIYEFEIKSADGKKTNSVMISNNEPVVTLVYKYSKQEILSSPIKTVKFFVTKIYLHLINIDFLLSSIIFFLPLFFYFLLIKLNRKFKFKRQYLAYLALALILVDSVFFVEYNSGILFILLGFWIFNVVMYKFDYSVSILINIILMLTALVIMSYSKLDPALDKLSIYIFFILIISVAQLILDFSKKPKDKINYLDVIRNFNNGKNK